MTSTSTQRQVWLSRLQVINWGVFDGYHDIRFSRNGTLITGDSGTGKSSLLDAVSLAFLSAQRRNFNASSDDTAAGSRSGMGKRTVDKYVRGLWGERQEPGKRPEPMFLRGEGPAWSAVAVTYTGTDDSVITGLVLKWLAAGAATDSSSSYHLIDADADILDLCNTWSDSGYARSVFESAGWQGKRDREGWYLDRLYAATGIGQQTAALQLLGKAKSLKNVGGLEQFVRVYMLDEPESYTAIRGAVDQITPLVDARNALSIAHRKSTVLGSIAEDHQHYVSESAELACIDVIDPQMARDWVDEHRLALIDPHVTALDAEIERIGEQCRSLTTERRRATAQRDALMERINSAGSGLATLQSELATAEARSEATSRERARYNTILWDLDFPVEVDDASEFEAMRITGREELTRITSAVAALDEKWGNQLGPQKKAARERMDAAGRLLRRAEVEGITVPEDAYRVRGEVAEALGVSPQHLPYVCELMDLRPEFASWRTAVERTLRSTGLVLLVPVRHHGAALSYLNDHNMRALVRVEQVPAAAPPAGPPKTGTLAECLHLTESQHECASTAQALINRAGDYVRVSHTSEFSVHPRAVTVQGLRQENKTRAVKDDRSELRRSQYIFQGNIESKIEALQAELAEATADFEMCEAAISELTAQKNALERSKELWQSLLNGFERYDDIDTATAEAEAARLQQQLDELEAAHPDLAKLKQQATDLLEHEQTLSGRISLLKTTESDCDTRRTRLLTLQETLHPGTVGAAARGALDQYRAAMQTTLDVLEPAPYRAELIRLVNADQERLRENVRRQVVALNRIITTFDEQFPDDIPNNSAVLDEKIHDYVALAQRIKARELPLAYERMHRLITEQAPTAALHLHQLAEDEALRIHEQIVRVSLGLSSVEFNRGTRLTLHADEKPLPAVTDLNDRARRISARATAVTFGDEQAIHEQYRDILELRNLLAADTAEARQWRRDALDVRNRFTFYCAERRADDPDALIRTYSNAGANSGGEQEKLMAFCLAGALSFNLADPATGDNRPVFSQLMLDEAFSKSDPVFAHQALSAFRQFGFQLLIVAAVQNTTTIQPYIDSVAMVSKRDEPGQNPTSSVRAFTVSEFADTVHDRAAENKAARRAHAHR
ncbi:MULTISPECIES: ATP-binding protein [Mycolicibacter]|uniref:Nuclease n=1 Tax=Mycolicibacter longobardus TaxID=1108812 RepID=A0A1X1YAJ3_9MYCO|nr:MULTISPECIES: ATP-binding protein [Mycolicibacter]ORW08034.1 nuclease [Mycolicibacter longobardus]RAV04316.1 nuclease [Mycolicibacter senuensis]